MCVYIVCPNKSICVYCFVRCSTPFEICPYNDLTTRPISSITHVAHSVNAKKRTSCINIHNQYTPVYRHTYLVIHAFAIYINGGHILLHSPYIGLIHGYIYIYMVGTSKLGS